MISNFHTHLKLCNHAVGMSEDYVKEAKKLKFRALGISDHAPLPNYNVSEEEYNKMYMNENMKLDEFYNIYLTDVLEAKKNNPDINILVGIETEYIKDFHDFYNELSKKLDYMILGVHFFSHNGRIIDSYEPLNEELVIAYAKSVSEALDTGLFKIIAHPDLFLINNLEFDDVCLKASKIILDACKRNNILVEINARGMRKTLENGEYQYPRKEFFKEAKKYDVEFIIGLDAHNPKEICVDVIKKAEDFCKNLGITPVNM